MGERSRRADMHSFHAQVQGHVVPVGNDIWWKPGTLLQLSGSRKPFAAKRPLWSVLSLACVASLCLLPRLAWVNASRSQLAGGVEAIEHAPHTPESARSLLTKRRLPCQAEYEPQRRKKKGRKWNRNIVNCEFTETSPFRGSVRLAGKQNHFHLLDRYIRRIDALVPEDMEDLVRPLTYVPDPRFHATCLRIYLDKETGESTNFTKDDVIKFFEPLEPSEIVIGWYGYGAVRQVHVRFHSNEDCRSGRQRDGKYFAGVPAVIRYTSEQRLEFVRDAIANRKKPGVMQAEEVMVEGEPRTDGGSDVMQAEEVLVEGEPRTDGG